MYERETETGQKVVWGPDDQNAAKQAMADVPGTGVPDQVTLPEEANVPLDGDTAQQVRDRYRELVAWNIAITLDDGQVQAGGTDTEPVSVTVTDQDGNAISEDVTVELDVDGETVDVKTASGEGVYDVTTTKAAGSTVTVQAAEVQEHHAAPSAELTIDVV